METDQLSAIFHGCQETKIIEKFIKIINTESIYLNPKAKDNGNRRTNQGVDSITLQ
jgi:hypothetical protein